MASESTEKVVGVWYDNTPEPEYRAWCVCEEELFEDGETAYTCTIGTHESREDAVIDGQALADQKGWRLVVQDDARTHGN